MFGRQKIAALVAEFVGVATLSVAILSVSRWTDFPYFAAIVAGLSVCLITLSMGAASGAHFNPAITLALWTARKIQTTQAAVYIAAQMLGGVMAWQLSEYLLNRPLRQTAVGGIDWRLFTAEAVGTLVLAIAIAAAVAKAYDWTKLALTAGLGLALGILVASLASNGIINPAVAVGLQSWSWVYVLGPLVGAVAGVNAYEYLFVEREHRKGRLSRTSSTNTAKNSAKKR